MAAAAGRTTRLLHSQGAGPVLHVCHHQSRCRLDPSRVWGSFSGQRPSTACAAIRARWCLDAKYGYKSEVTQLLQEWVQTVGAAAGLSSTNVQLSTGAVGCPESRLELEVTLDSVADWEDFLARVPAQEHRAWSQRMQGMVVDGTPTWHVYRVVPLGLEDERSTASSSSSKASTRWSTSSSTTRGAEQTSASGLILPSLDGGGMDAALQAEVSAGLPSAASGATPGGPPPGWGSTSSDAAAAADAGADDDGEIMLDWKGEPMRIKKGDKMPRFL